MQADLFWHQRFEIKKVWVCGHRSRWPATLTGRQRSVSELDVVQHQLLASVPYCCEVFAPEIVRRIWVRLCDVPAVVVLAWFVQHQRTSGSPLAVRSGRQHH